MLNDYGRSLFTPVVSVQNILLAGGAIFLFVVFKLSSGEVASWVQAVGSIAAIAGAFAISQRQLKKGQYDKISETISKTEIHHAITDQAHQHSMFFANITNDGTCLASIKDNMTGRARYMFVGLYEAMKEIQVHDLGSPMLVISHMHIMSSMASMIRSMDLLLKTDEKDGDEIWRILASIHGDDFMLQGAWKMHVTAYTKRLEALSEEAKSPLP